MTKKQSTDEQLELLRTLLIVQLILAGIPQRNIREIAACDMNRVSIIARLMGSARQSEPKNGGK